MDVFSSRGSQESVLNQEATQKKRPTCVLCYQVSTTEAVHRTHVNEAHDGPISKRMKPLQCLWCPKVYQSRKGLKKHLLSCPGSRDLSFPLSCSVCEVEIASAKALSSHVTDCKSWPVEEDDFDKIDAQLIEDTGHPAIARFVNDIFKQAEVTLPGGEKVYAYLPLCSSKRMGDGTEAYIRPLKRRSDEVITDSKLELALRSHAYCSLVNIENYRALGDNDPICTVRFSDQGKALSRSLASLLIQSGHEILLCLKVEVYGRRESEDAHNIPRLGEPDGSRSFKVTNQRHDNTQMIIIGTVRWNALVTMAVMVTNGKVIVGPHNPWFHPHAASHVWLLKNGNEDLNNNVERHTRSKFDQQSSYELFAAVHPRFLGHCTMPVTLSTLWEFKAKGKAKPWSGIKLASFVFHQLLNRGKMSKSDLALQMVELQVRENSSTEMAADGIVANFKRLLEAMSDEETKPVSLKVSNELRQLAEKLQSEITNINNTIIAEEAKMLIGFLVKSKQEK